MSEPGGDWKRQALEDFRRWLDAVGDEPPEPEEPDPADCDLRDLFAEFSALRQEIRLQNREQARAGRELSAAAAHCETTARAAERGDETLAAFEKRVSRTAEDRCLVEPLEVCDALVRGQDAAVYLRDRRRLFARPPRGVGGVVEGLRAGDQTTRSAAVPVRRPACGDRRTTLRRPGHARGGGAQRRPDRGRPGGRGAAERVRAAR